MDEHTIDFGFLDIVTDENDRNHIIKQLNCAVKYLGDKFCIPFSEIVYAAMLTGVSFARRGSTFSKDFVLILGDILALKGIDIKNACVLENVKMIDTNLELQRIEVGYKAVYGILDKDKELIYIGMSTNLKKRLEGYKIELPAGEKKNTCEFLYKKIKDGECLEFGKNFSFAILAVPSEQIEFEYEFQKTFLLSYLECKLILEKTILKGNRKSYTGDSCIPLVKQKEIYKRYHKVTF